MEGSIEKTVHGQGAQVHTVDHRTIHESPGFSDLWQQKRILAYDLEGGFRHVDVAILRLNSVQTLC